MKVRTWNWKIDHDMHRYGLLPAAMSALANKMHERINYAVSTLNVAHTVNQKTTIISTVCGRETVHVHRIAAIRYAIRACRTRLIWQLHCYNSMHTILSIYHLCAMRMTIAAWNTVPDLKNNSGKLSQENLPLNWFASLVESIRPRRQKLDNRFHKMSSATKKNPYK